MICLQSFVMCITISAFTLVSSTRSEQMAKQHVTFCTTTSIVLPKISGGRTPIVVGATVKAMWMMRIEWSHSGRGSR